MKKRHRKFFFTMLYILAIAALSRAQETDSLKELKTKIRIALQRSVSVTSSPR